MITHLKQEKMSKTLTVVIHNLDEEFLKSYWKDAIKFAKTELSVTMDPVEIVEIDAEKMGRTFLEGFSSLMASISAGHAITTADKFFNSQVGQSKQ